MQEETKILISSTNGDVVIDDFKSRECQCCIVDNCQIKNIASTICPRDHATKKLFYRNNEVGIVQICDTKEKTKNNFVQMAELVWHNMKSMIELQNRIRQQEVERINTELTVFKHNIETINGESIREFENAISTKRLRNSYKEIVKVVEETIEKSNTMPSFIARQALNNLRIQTEIMVSKIIGDRYDSKSTLSNPWNAIMTNVYLLYPSAQKNSIKINMKEYSSSFNVDYNAVKVAAYYILDNAIKYCSSNSEVSIAFEEDNSNLKVSFVMTSPVILPEETTRIFDKGYRGENVKRFSEDGNGYGLFCAKKLLKSAFADIYVVAGPPKYKRNGRDYATNEFVIVLPTRLPAWK